MALSPSRKRSVMDGAAPTFVGLLRVWPDKRAIADDLHCPYYTVAAWFRRQHVPVQRWESLVRAARRRGLHGVTFSRFRSAAAEYERHRCSIGAEDKAPVLLSARCTELSAVKLLKSRK